jgi:hypothetical protein
MTIIHFPGHKWARCRNHLCLGCVFCEGGLASCTTCGGAEGSLTTDCPGQRMTVVAERAVYLGELDFRRNQGWVNARARVRQSRRRR